MIEFITPKMYGLDDTLTQPGFGADAKAVGDALAAIEVGGGGIPEAPTNELWELEPGIYRMSYGFQWGKYEPPVNPRYMPISEGLCVIGKRPNDVYNKTYTILADGKVYYGRVSKMTGTNIDTGEPIDIIEGTCDYIEKVETITNTTSAKFGVPSSGAVKTYIDSFGLKTLTLGNLKKAYIQNLETGIYCVSVEEGGRAGIYAGKSAHHVMDTAYLIVGGSNYTEETADKDGVTRYNKSFILLNGVTNQAFYYAGLIDSEKLDGVWTHTKVSGDVIETKDNKATTIDETIRDHTKYVSALAVKEYVDGAIDGIEIPVIPDLNEYAKKTDIPDTTGFITSEDVESYGYATEDFVIDYVDNNAGGGSGGSDCGIYLWPGSELRISEMSTGVYTLQNAEVYYQDDTTAFGGEDPAKLITIDYGVLTVKELDMGEDGLLLQFTIVSGEEIYKGYTTVALMEDGSRIGVSGEINTVSVNIVQDLDEVEGEDEMTAVPSVQLIKEADYITSNQLNQKGYQTEAQVIALIEANMPASAEEVEY